MSRHRTTLPATLGCLSAMLAGCVGVCMYDSSLVIGRSDHGWLEARPVSLPGLRSHAWYHLDVAVVHPDYSKSEAAFNAVHNFPTFDDPVLRQLPGARVRLLWDHPRPRRSPLLPPLRLPRAATMPASSSCPAR